MLLCGLADPFEETLKKVAFPGAPVAEDGFQRLGALFGETLGEVNPLRGHLDGDDPFVILDSKSADQPAFAEALDGGGDGPAGQSDASAQSIDGLGTFPAEAIEDTEVGWTDPVHAEEETIEFGEGLFPLAHRASHPEQIPLLPLIGSCHLKVRGPSGSKKA
jgi:hypothetical protein